MEFPRCFPPRSRSSVLLLMPFPPGNELLLCKSPAWLPTPLLRQREELGANWSRWGQGAYLEREGERSVTANCPAECFVPCSRYLRGEMAKGEAALRSSCFAPWMGGSARSAPFLRGWRRLSGEPMGLDYVCLCRSRVSPLPCPPRLRVQVSPGCHGHLPYQLPGPRSLGDGQQGGNGCT